MRIHLPVMLAGLLAAGAAAPETHSHEGGFGTVKFDTSCSAEAQPQFTRGAALLHSFEFAPAREAFMKAWGADPRCGIALWGVALTHWGNPFATGLKLSSLIALGT